jgi:serine/threonine-protein kinase
MDRVVDATSAETAAIEVSSGVASSAAEEGRFVPGTLMGGRYRIIALLGRGGMGEVYRATDLTLGQSVALKFLPEEAARDQRLLERFHGEVRIARQVSHPNVCRVYDIGEFAGMPFLSMEYVDGEDLASLLPRIGRLPADKAVETARRICAGLAAAHDRGVIHRDLKPANIMINKRGDTVIMDFGLAALASGLSGPEARNGTPAYMAPEQLKGAKVTPKSDIYSLGLVFYELFTGKRPYDGKTLEKLLEQQEAAQLTSLTTIAADIDPAVERVIRRCLYPDPTRRPATARQVAVALPGGDPLAAALAAGETPSPETVAAAGETEGLSRKYAVPCLAVIVLGLFAVPLIRERLDALVHAPVDYPPEVLAQKARDLASSFGYYRRPSDTALELNYREDLLDYLKKLPGPRRWTEWLAAEAPVAAVYRESPKALYADPFGRVRRPVRTGHEEQPAPRGTRHGLRSVGWQRSPSRVFGDSL